MDEWLRSIERRNSITIHPITSKIALRSVSLEAFHRDPADRLIVATALGLDLPLVTSDRKIRSWGRVVVV